LKVEPGAGRRKTVSSYARAFVRIQRGIDDMFVRFPGTALAPLFGGSVVIAPLRPLPFLLLLLVVFVMRRLV